MWARTRWRVRQSEVYDIEDFTNIDRDEDLIAHGWQEDVWFHVDNLSSAHIYLRLRADEGETWTSIPEDLLTDCAQLTKANSIEGNKKDNVTVIYTPWSNLKKSGDMATGQVGFKDNKMVRRVYVQQRENAIINRLNKTREEKHPDLRAEKAEREKDIRRRERIAAQDKVCGATCVSSTILHRERDTDGYATCRSSKTGRKQKNMRSRSGRRNICTTICIRKTTWRCPAIRIAMLTSWTTSCRQLGGQQSSESRQIGDRRLKENKRVDSSPFQTFSCCKTFSMLIKCVECKSIQETEVISGSIEVIAGDTEVLYRTLCLGSTFLRGSTLMDGTAMAMNPFLDVLLDSLICSKLCSPMDWY